MNKKISSFICIALIVIISIPVVSIVFARKPDRGPLEKIVFIHYKKGYGKPEGTPGKGPDKGGDDDYYKLLGAKWKNKDLPVAYYIDPAGSGLDLDSVTSAIFASAEEWDSWTRSELFSDDYEVITDGSWDDTVEELDGRNELVFGNYPDPDVIAVCIVWGYFREASGKGQIVEFDIMFDTDFTWGDATDATLDATVMDLQNIATHELGHGVGLADLDEDAAKEQTMYGYSGYGETKKRTLEDGDIAGIQKLYGK